VQELIVNTDLDVYDEGLEFLASKAPAGSFLVPAWVRATDVSHKSIYTAGGAYFCGRCGAVATCSRRGRLQKVCDEVTASRSRITYLMQGSAAGVSGWTVWPNGANLKTSQKVFRLCSDWRQHVDVASASSSNYRPAVATASSSNGPLAALAPLASQPASGSSSCSSSSSNLSSVPAAIVTAVASSSPAAKAPTMKTKVGSSAAAAGQVASLPRERRRPPSEPGTAASVTVSAGSRCNSPPAALGKEAKEQEEEALAELAALQSEGRPVVWPQQLRTNYRADAGGLEDGHSGKPSKLQDGTHAAGVSHQHAALANVSEEAEALAELAALHGDGLPVAWPRLRRGI
jgi:hypothetical protein